MSVPPAPRRPADELVTSDALYAVLAAAAAPARPGPQPGEQAALGAFRAASRPVLVRVPTAAWRWSTGTRARVVASLTTGVVVLSGGVAAAATGALPAPAQHAAHTVLAAVGVHVPPAPAATAARPTPRPVTPASGRERVRPAPRPARAREPRRIRRIRCTRSIPCRRRTRQSRLTPRAPVDPAGRVRTPSRRRRSTPGSATRPAHADLASGGAVMLARLASMNR